MKLPFAVVVVMVGTGNAGASFEAWVVGCSSDTWLNFLVVFDKEQASCRRLGLQPCQSEVAVGLTFICCTPVAIRQ